MNSAGVIRADGQAKIQVGDSYTTIHNYRDSSRCPADPRLAETDKVQLRTKFLRQLRTTPYEERKNRNPRRADGTCEWFTSHPLFQHWRKETSALLWVSADPGCGKSVLARYLVDDVLPSSATRTTCYFFFKDDFDDQRVLEGALCCLLHQLFTQKPALLSDKILEGFREEGDQSSPPFSKLWDILIAATRNHRDGEIVCIIDALDECVGQKLLAEAVTKHYSNGKGNSTLKFLVTSRPYLRIQHVFQDLKESQPTIHLSGESEEEVDKIAQEITICIEQRIEQLCKRLKLAKEEKQILYEELATGSHRTYLWVHLVFDVIEDAVFLTRDDLRTSIRNLPRTVEEAYERILRKSRDPENARRILHIVVAADRPLHLTEMAAVLTFRGSHQCHKDLARDILSLDHLRIAIRENCGLFVVIQDSQLFLLHQTAREFLVQSPQLPPQLSDVRSPPLEWQHSLDLKESHRLLSDICIRYLLLADFQVPVREMRLQKSDDELGFVFLDYAASNWPDHYRQAHNAHRRELEILALQLCDTNSRACSIWLSVYSRKRPLGVNFDRDLSTSLLIASYFGLDNLVKLILQDKKTRFDTRGPWSRRTALSWASEKGYNLIVQLLLDRLLLNGGARVNASDKTGATALMHASFNGHTTTVQLLLDGGAKVNPSNAIGITALMHASNKGHDAIVKLLLDSGAKIDASDLDGWTPLTHASHKGHNAVVQLLLDRNANLLNSIR
ncbi:hypothetical protein F5X97DRAFT_335665 [Nemania serpens]|nr:hypothetical protein F5X97DRAFT_335665 [Nemania serpens]